ncbi:MAG: ferredoxin-type protein NapG [Bacteroidales bacterium]|nr:ferredoxin-type protein NapG [Bacteroidales bacterium]
MNKSTNRRDALTKIAQGLGILSIGGIALGGAVKQNMRSELTLRPPGALDEKMFLKACLKCGNCVTSCPYDTLVLAKPGDGKPLGTPYFEARKIPCYMCPDMPCIEACPSGALDFDLVTPKATETETPKPDINHAKMGVAIIDQKSCVAFWGIQCDACYRVCPLIDQAICLEYSRNERTGKHAFLRPQINTDVCTGCGKCEHACITERASIMILPRDKALGKAGDFYVKGWQELEDERIKNTETQEHKEPNSKVEDYLDNWEDLIDE